MPPPQHRKKPFSNKKKKEQLKSKREKKRNEGRREQRDEKHGMEELGSDCDEEEETEEGTSSTSSTADVRKMNQQPSAAGEKPYDANRYRLHFLTESAAELEKRKAKTRKPYNILPEECLEVDLDDTYRPGTVLDMPKRPKWNATMSKSTLEAREEAYFKRYLDCILEKHKPEDLSYFELNLETWRQLWRVLEMADVVLLISDIRHPALHFPPAFYTYVTEELKKPLIFVLNKIDLAPPSLVVAWREYFKQQFPDVHVVYFTQFPQNSSTEENTATDPGSVLHKKEKRRVMPALGPQQLLKACQEIVKDRVDLTSWKEKIQGEIDGTDTSDQVHVRMEEVPDSTDHIPYRDGILTLGCCGYPNVGKSSLMNGLMGKKVVSVSRTPGHTKHFQTIYLTPTVKMCDSPGLVFPSLVEKPMQILAGIYPIAQVREPYSAVQYLAERLDLPTLLKLRHPNHEPHPERPQPPWSAFDICDAWAEKKGFLTAKAARTDVYRAANHLMRLSGEGRLCLCTRPPGYAARRDEWEKHADVAELQTLLAKCDIRRDLDDLHSDLEYESEEEDEDREDNEDNENIEEEPRYLSTNNPFDLLGEDD